MQNNIFVKIFKNKEKLYCYDVATNNLMQIDPILGEVLKEYDYNNNDHVLKKLGKRYGENDVYKAIQTIEQFNKNKGGFILKKRIKLEFPFNKKEYKKLLDVFLSHMILNITEDCNFRCKYCSYSGSYKYSRLHSPHSMSWPTIKESIDFFVKRSQATISETERSLTLGFYGGEPLLQKEKIFQAVEYIKSRYKSIFPRFNFTMTTNGALLTKEVSSRLMEYDFSIFISLDGPAEIHDRYRVFKSGRGTFSSITKNIENIKRLNLDFFKKNIGFSIITAPEFRIKEVIDFFRNSYPTQESTIIFSMVDPFDTTFFDRFDMNNEERNYDRDFKIIERDYIKSKVTNKNDHILSCFFKEDLSDIHDRYLFQIPDQAYPNGICPPGLQRVFVDTNGNIHLCEKGNLKFSIGDIKRGFDIEKIFLYIEEYIKTTDHCPDCWAIRFCKDCFLTAISGDKFSKERKKITCKMRRLQTLKKLKTYVEIVEKNPEAFKEGHVKRRDILEDAMILLSKDRFRIYQED